MEYSSGTNPQAANPEAGAAPAGSPSPEGGAPSVSDSEFEGLVAHPGIAEQGETPAETPSGAAAAGDDAPSSGEPQGGPTPGEGSTPFTPFTIRFGGKEHQVDSLERARELAGKGLDYTVKTQELARHRGNLELIYGALADPERGPRLRELLTGKPAAEGQGKTPEPKDQGRDRGGAGDFLVPMAGPDGQTVYVPADPGAVSLVEQVVQRALAPLLERSGQAPAEPARQADPYLAGVVQQQKEAAVAEYITRNWPELTPWAQARETVAQAMASDGIGPGDPRNSDPGTWLTYYTHLAMGGRLPKPATQPGGQTKPVNKSELKAAARTPTPALTPPPKANKDELVEMAFKSGSDEDFLAAIDHLIEHPDLT